MDLPKIILLISGKRKSGKDFICEKLIAEIGDRCCIVRISGPLKRLYATNHHLDFNELLSDSPYKEQYRLNMIKWSDEIRKKTPGYFCKAACDEAKLLPVWIVSDIRRKTDIQWFQETYGVKIVTIRILAKIEVRQLRGWKFTVGIDDVSSECDLDDYPEWNYQLHNNNMEESQHAIETIRNIIDKHL